MPAVASAPSSPAALRQWTTDVVAQPARLDYWVGAICEAFLEMDCSSREAPLFGGELQSLPVETLSINRVRASTQDVFRTPAGIARSRQLPFYLIGQAETAWHVRQDGHVAHLRPGDVVLLDSARPYELHFPGGVHCVSLQLPRAWVGQWLQQAEAPGPRVAWRDQGWGQSPGGAGRAAGTLPGLGAGLAACVAVRPPGRVVVRCAGAAPATGTHGGAQPARPSVCAAAGAR